MFNFMFSKFNEQNLYNYTVLVTIEILSYTRSQFLRQFTILVLFVNISPEKHIEHGYYFLARTLVYDCYMY